MYNQFIPYRFYTILLLVFLCGTGCQENPSPSAESGTSSAPFAHSGADGTPQMIRLIREAVEKIQPEDVIYYKNAERAEYFKKLMENSSDPMDILYNQLLYGTESLNAGKNEQAVQIFEDLLKKVEQSNLQASAGYPQILHMLALSYIRIGEQENCLTNFNPDRCIMPFEGAGLYEVTQAVRTSIRYYEKILELNPEDYKAIWMLNFAFMALGEFPDKVPPRWRLEEKAFKSDYNIPRFPNIADKVGLHTLSTAGGTCMDDFDRDGFLDIIVSSWEFHDHILYFRNNGDGTFTERSTEAGLGQMPGGLHMVQADYNNDGWLDILVLRGGWYGSSGKIPNSLLRNNGNGTFSDVTIEAGLLSYYPTQAAVWADFNNDGWLDLFIGNETRDLSDPYPSELYMSNRDGTFTNRITDSKLHTLLAMVKGCAAADVNNDGWTDLYISFLNARNILVINQGPISEHAVAFRYPTDKTTVELPVASFPCWFFDYNNDGWEDLYVSAYSFGSAAAEKIDALEISVRNFMGESAGGNPMLYRNKGDGSFEEVSEELGLTDGLFAMGCNYGDLDNDGWLDFYLATGTPKFSAVIPNKMFRNAEGKYFQDVTTAGGFGHIQKGHSVGFGDMDNDGDQDIYNVIGGAFEGDLFGNAFFLNPAGNEKNWITLQLEGTLSNRSAIGARVKITVLEPSGKERSLFHTVSTGASFGSNSLQLEAGLDDAVSIKSIEVRWPNREGTIQLFDQVEMNQFIKIKEGMPGVSYLPVKKIQFNGSY